MDKSEWICQSLRYDIRLYANYELKQNAINESVCLTPNATYKPIKIQIE